MVNTYDSIKNIFKGTKEMRDKNNRMVEMSKEEKYYTKLKRICKKKGTYCEQEYKLLGLEANMPLCLRIWIALRYKNYIKESKKEQEV